MTEHAEQIAEPALIVSTAEQLSHLLPALWRGVVKLARAADQMPTVEDQVTVLRRVVATGGSTPADLASTLHVSRPTISKLVKELVSAGMVQRRPSDADGRSVMIMATETGHAILTEFRRGRVEVISEAVARMDDRDRRILEVALPSLNSLLDLLDLMETEALQQPASVEAAKPSSA